MHREQCRVAELRVDHPPEVCIDLPDVSVVVRAELRHAVAWAIGCRADEVVALVDGEHEERVLLGDAVGGEPVEELLECRVVVEKLLVVTRLARPVREVDVPGGSVAVVRVRDVRVSDRDTGLLHLGDPGQRDGRLHAVEAREADAAGRILDHVAVQVRHRAARLDQRVDVLRTE